MKKNTLDLALMLLMIGSILISCSPSTKITGSWKSPELGSDRFEDIFIIGLTENFINRKIFEEDMAKVLSERGVKSQISVNALKPGQSIYKTSASEIEDAVKTKGSDAVLTMGLIDQTSETRYVPGSAYPMAGYGFRGYYGYYGGMAYSPGYYSEDKSYFIEIKLFDVKSGNMIWSAQSETTNPGKVESAAMEFTRVVVDRMVKDGIL